MSSRERRVSQAPREHRDSESIVRFDSNREDGGSVHSKAPMLRRMSSWRRVSDAVNTRRFSTFAGRRASTLTGDDARSTVHVKLEPTYKMEPDPGTRFKPAEVEAVISELLKMTLDKETYDKETSPVLARRLSELIKARVKKMNFKRYKIVATVYVGSLQEQGLNLASRCLWDQKHDNYASATYKNASIFAVAVVYGVYFE